MADLIPGRIRLSFRDRIESVFGGFAAMLCVGAAPVAGEKPMLWEATTQTVSGRLLDPEYADKWFHNVGPPQTQRLCLNPFQPIIGKVQRADVDCKYTRVSNRQGKVYRRLICNGDPSSSFITIITGKETDDAYELLLVTTVRNDRGKKLWVSKTRETGRRIGKCPVGMSVDQ